MNSSLDAARACGFRMDCQNRPGDLEYPLVEECGMTVHVNGQPKELDASATVAALVDVLGLTQKRIAVEVNKELVVKEEWAARVLREGDRVEVVTFVGGG